MLAQRKIDEKNKHRRHELRFFALFRDGLFNKIMLLKHV